ncbi:MAG: YvrJ family protein [Synergistaceae bacterium]|nr:YvrJ family protein [Synergistaceae bacterium]
MEGSFWKEVLQGSFSVGVAVFLLVRMEARLDGLTNAIARLGSSLETLANFVRSENIAMFGKPETEEGRERK